MDNDWSTGEILAVPIIDWPLFCCLAWEIGAFKTEIDSFLMCTASYFTHLVLFRCTSLRAVRTGIFRHSRTFFTSDTAYSYLHKNTFSPFDINDILFDRNSVLFLKFWMYLSCSTNHLYKEFKNIGNPDGGERRFVWYDYL
jgi:hypothetical protein